MKRFIRDLKEKDHLQTVFLVTEKTAGMDRNGKGFLSMTLSDASGQINARMFEKVDGVADTFSVGDVVWTKGFVQLFQNRKQVIVHEIRRAAEGEYVIADLVAGVSVEPMKYFDSLCATVNGLKNPFIKQLLSSTLQDPAIRELFLKSPAAKTIHHAYRGGLIEHVHSIVKSMLFLSEQYPFLNVDLLIFGAIYHDLGKIFELNLAEGIHYTERGRLVGHMALACEMIDERANQIPDFPVDLKDVLKHIVLSHHGKLEYGSPKLPMLAEAIVVAMVDDLDSKLNTLFHFLKNEVDSVAIEEKWSRYHTGFERYFFLEFFRKEIQR